MGLLLDLIGVLDVKDWGLARLFAELDQAEDLADLSPQLDGESVMDILGLAPGPEVGAALGVLRERRLEEGPVDRAAEVSHLLERYRQNR